MQDLVIKYLRKRDIDTLIELLDTGITEDYFNETVGLIDSFKNREGVKYTGQESLKLLELWYKLIIELGWTRVYTQGALTEVVDSLGYYKKLVNNPKHIKYKGYYTSEFYSKLIKITVSNPNNTTGIEDFLYKWELGTIHSVAGNNIYDHYAYLMDLDRQNGVETSWSYDDEFVDIYLTQSTRTYLNKLNYLEQFYINTSIFHSRHSHLRGTVIDRKHQQAKERVQKLHRQGVRALRSSN